MRITLFLLLFSLCCNVGKSRVQCSQLQVSAFVEKVKRGYNVKIALNNSSTTNLYVEYPVSSSVNDFDTIYYFNRKNVYDNIFTFFTGLPTSTHSREDIVPEYNFFELEASKTMELTFYLSKRCVNRGRGVFVFRYALTHEAFNTGELYKKNVFDKMVVVNFN